MTTHKTAALEGAALNAAVALADAENYAEVVTYRDYSTRWGDGGPIIERERISVIGLTCPLDPSRVWLAEPSQALAWPMYGPTPLIAAMRAFVASKLGDEVELP